ncbi:MAG: polyamine aminopropyltransferase [Deltaproteobacteria bacterium]|nr:polyamine aminopropyltransferase [Deltaproteobacteria bacterium]MBM4293542.1 polyamine aminopropyltransferase [Deltaproteobacteria bacterium]
MGAIINETDIPAGFPEGWFIDLWTPGELVAFRKREILAAGNTPFQTYEIFVSGLWGRVLILDDRLQSTEKDEFIYHEALVQPALTAHPRPRRVMVMGGGEGAALREVLRHRTVERAVMVDLDGELVEVCRRWLPTFHQGALDDPRAELIAADGRGWLASQPDAAFDVIVLDLPEPLEAGPALTLFTREMYLMCRGKLAPGGILAVQSGSAGVQGRLMPDLWATLNAVFPRVMAYAAFIPSFMDLYGFHLAAAEDFAWPSPAEVAARLEERGATGLRWFGPAYSQALPYQPEHLRERLTTTGRVLTDARPFAVLPGEMVFF